MILKFKIHFDNFHCRRILKFEFYFNQGKILMSKAIVDLRDKIDPELHLINQKCLVDNLSTTLIFTKSALYG